ncbi:MAG: hypothetical protein WBA10_15315 [Elainellaceae cyanobacterium]
MSDSSDSNVSPPNQSPPRQPKLGDRIRTIARQLRQEDQVQIEATSRILGAAAQIAENHDRLVEEVTDMVEEDLDQMAALQPEPHISELHSVEQLQQQFDSFKAAKAHFNITARGWEGLVDKLNAQRPVPSTTASAHGATPHPPSPFPQDSSHRLDAIEQELRAMRGDLARVLHLVEQIAQKLS